MAKRTWLDGQVGNTPLTAARLTAQEDAIEREVQREKMRVYGDPHYDDSEMEDDTDNEEEKFVER